MAVPAASCDRCLCSKRRVGKPSRLRILTRFASTLQPPPNVVAGRFFWLPQKINNHPWVIISDPLRFPLDEVLAVNFTGVESWKDLACVVTTAECPDLSKDSCIYYGGACVGRREDLESATIVTFCGIVSPAILTRIRNGMISSSEARKEHRSILVRQNLV